MPVTYSTEVFADGLESPNGVNILFNRLQNLEKEIKILRDIGQAAQEARWKVLRKSQICKSQLTLLMKSFKSKNRRGESGR